MLISRCSLVAAVLLTTLTAFDGSAAPAAPTGGFTNPREVDFDSPADLDGWIVYNFPDTLPRRSGDLTSVEGGTLRLRGSTDAAGNPVGSGAAQGISQQYGRWEVRFRAEAGNGYGAVVLLWPSRPYTFPTDGEIDILESPRDGRQWGVNVVHLGPRNDQQGHRVAADFTQWHTVSVDWSPGSLVYFLDGVETWRAPANLVPDKVMHLAVQLDECAFGFYPTGWIPCRDATSPPTVTMEVDWVRVWSYDPSAPSTPSPSPSPSPSTSTTALDATPPSLPPPAQPIADEPPFTG